MTYEQVKAWSCRSYLDALGSSLFADVGPSLIEGVSTLTSSLGSGANIVDFVAIECRLHESLTVGQAVQNLIGQAKQNQLPRISIGGATDSPEIHANWQAFDNWLHHKGPRPEVPPDDVKPAEVPPSKPSGPRWVSVEASNGAVTKVDTHSIQRGNGAAIVFVYADEGNPADAYNLQGFLFDCQGHYSLMGLHHSEMVYAPPRSVAARVSAIACAAPVGTIPR